MITGNGSSHISKFLEIPSSVTSLDADQYSSSSLRKLEVDSWPEDLGVLGRSTGEVGK